MDPGKAAGAGDGDEGAAREETPRDPPYDPAIGFTCNSRKDVLHHLKDDHAGESQCRSSSYVPRKRNETDVTVHIEIESSPNGLPLGWIKETRCKRSASHQRKDSYYKDPVTGTVFRSKKEVLRYLKTGQISKKVSGRKSKVLSTMESPPAQSLLVTPASCNGTPQASSGLSGGESSSQSPRDLRSEPVTDRSTVFTTPDAENKESTDAGAQDIPGARASDANLIHIAESGIVSGRVGSSGVRVVVGKPSPGMRYKKLAIRRPLKKKATLGEAKPDMEDRDPPIADPKSPDDKDPDQVSPNMCSLVDSSHAGPSEKPDADAVRTDDDKRCSTENRQSTKKKKRSKRAKGN